MRHICLHIVGIAFFVLAGSESWAQGKQLKGTMFVTVMNGNTISGTTAENIEFKAYFLSGGNATYEDAAGNRDRGRWYIKREEQVCVTWEKRKNGLEQCAIVTLDGHNLSWKGKGGSGRAKLLGSVLPGFPSP